ncbi:MAG: DUF1015 family protein [Bdellovibrionota bacterium]
MLHPFAAAYYSPKNRAQLSQLIVSDLDTAEHLWGGRDSSRNFRNILVGPTEQRGELWQAWISSGEVELADDERYYVLHQSQRVEGKQIDRWGLYASIAVNDQTLFTHEDVLPEGMERARQGTEACESDVAPIFVGCEEGVGAMLRELLGIYCRDRKPFLRVETLEKGAHAVWAVEDAGVSAQIRKLFEGTPLFLLDGHHRLAAARENYRLGMSDGRILACVCSMARSDTLILPIHRAVHHERWTLPDALTADLLRAGCKVNELPELRVNGIQDFLDTHSSSAPFCVVQHSHATKPLLVELPALGKLPPQLSSLAVAALDYGVMAEHPQATVIPAPSLDLALQQLALDQAQAAFFLPATSPGQVRAIALSRLRMPRKSTRFTPKPALGLLCRPWTSSG